MKLSRCCFLLLALLPGVLFSDGKDEEYGKEVYKKGLNVQSRLTVLSISLQPGFEDLAALAYLRFGRGAKIVNAFVTNGESGDNGSKVETPGEVAFHKRAEAFEVSSALQGSEYFLNFPDFGSARDTVYVREYWADSLESKILELIESFRPDLILLAPDRQESDIVSARWQFVRAALGRAVRTAAQTKTSSGFVRPRFWKVGRVVVAQRNGRFSFPLEQKPVFDSRSFKSIAADLAPTYRSLKGILSHWQETDLRYTVDYPAPPKSLKSPDAGVPGTLPAGIRNLGKQMDGLWKYIQTSVNKRTLRGSKSVALKRLVSIMDSIDIRLSGWHFFANEDRKTLLHWKEGLEELRNAIVGISVRYTMRDTVLLARQITTLRIDSVEGLPSGGITEIFFPDVGPRWFLNEDVQPKVPLTIGSEYRLISPAPVELDLPMSYGGRMRSQHGSPFEFFIIHQKKSRAESIFKKTAQRILFAPKLTVEPLTPIIRVIPHEQFAYRITNHANDGILDRLGINDTLATAEPKAFRINTKDSSVVDTLELHWSDSIPPGTYRVPLHIGQAVVGYLAARKFEARIDSSRVVGVLPSGERSVLIQTLRRLGVPYRILKKATEAAALDILVVDERLLSLRPETVDSHVSFGEFMDRGGTLLVLSQDAESWNELKMFEGISLTATASFDAQSPVAADSLHPVIGSPNRLTEQDWEEWLFSRSPNRVEVSAEVMATVPVVLEAGNRTPAVLVFPRGKGKLVYVNLNLGKQLENIHPGAFRILANLLAF